MPVSPHDVLESGPPRRRRVLGAAALAAVAVVTAATAPSVVTSLRTVPRDVPAPAAAPAPPKGLTCPRSTYPTRDPGGYAVAISADITGIVLDNGWNEKYQNWQSVASNITAKACGLMQLPSLDVTIDRDDLIFDTSKAKIVTRIGTTPIFKDGDVAVTLAPTADATTDVDGVRPPADPDAGQLDLSATTAIIAHVVNGKTNPTPFDCPTSPVATLSTGMRKQVPIGRGPKGPVQPGKGLAPWTVQGTPLSGPLVGAQALVIGNDFPLPLFPASGDCALYAGIFNPVFGGQSEAGLAYIDKDVHPPGSSWVTGTLKITAVDPKALGNGPPDQIPGT